MAKRNVNEAKDKIRSEQQAIVRLTNNDLVCKDCVQRYDDSVIFGNTTKCEYYPICKPDKVIAGGDCNEYVKE